MSRDTPDGEVDPLAEYGPVIHPPRKLTLDQIEYLLEHEDDVAITILPNGEVVATADGSEKPRKPLTYRENLGGEYAFA